MGDGTARNAEDEFRVLRQLPVAIALLDGPELRFRAVSDAYQRLVGNRVAVGARFRDVLPELESVREQIDFHERLQRVLEDGVPFVGADMLVRWDVMGDGTVEERFVDVVYAPIRSSSDTDGVAAIDGVAIVVQDVSDRVRITQALRESEKRFRNMANAAPVMLWVTDADGRCTFLNRQWLEFTGQTLDGGLGFGWLDAVHPDDRAMSQQAFESSNSRQLPFRLDYRLRRADGTYRWAIDAAAPRWGADGKYLGYIGSVIDIEERISLLQAERDAHRVAEVAADRARRLQELTAGLNRAITRDEMAQVIFDGAMAAMAADAGSLAFVRSDDDGNPTAFEMALSTGYDAQLSSRYREFPVVAGRPLSDSVLDRRVLLIASPDEWRHRFPQAQEDLSSVGYNAFAAMPVIAHDRVVAALSFSFRDARAFDDSTRTFLATIAEQCALAMERVRLHELERQRSAENLALVQTVQDALRRSAFIAEASRLLGASLDYQRTLAAVAEISVPTLGDWCALTVIEDPTLAVWPPVVERVAVVHRDPAKLALGMELEARYPTQWNQPSPMATVLRSGEPFMLPHVTDDMVVAGALDPEHLRLLRALQFSAIIIAPLRARGLTLGALTLCMAESGRRYTESDLALARDLAQRAAIAVDNARLFRDAERARAEAETANVAKSQFLATMSHELRTPLNAIQGHVQLLELGVHGPISDVQRETLGRVARAERHLLGLIDDVLSYARLEGGRIEYHFTLVRLDEVVRDVVSLVEAQYAAKEITLQVDLAPTMMAWTDRERLAQVLLNLLTNAVKFTPSGGRVEVCAEQGDRAGSARVRLIVRDNGIGIPPDKHEAIFQPFVQLRGPYDPGAGGTGLGLAISRDLVRGMAGELSVIDQLQRGAAFMVDLPAWPAASGDITNMMQE